MTIRTTTLGGTNWAFEENLLYTDMNDTLNKLALIAPPIGSVVAWLKSYTNTPSLPTGWVECNGQTLSDSESVYNGQTIPNLNASGGGTQRFLRGNTTSGGTGGSDSHTHTFTTDGASNNASGPGDPFDPTGAIEHTHTGTTDSTSTLPSYYEVVWVMRVK